MIDNNPQKTIYADHAATTPLLPMALEAMMPYLTDSFGNDICAGGNIMRLPLNKAAV